MSKTRISATRLAAGLVALLASGAFLVQPVAAQAPPAAEPKPAAPAPTAKPPAPTGTPKVALETTMGRIVIELNPQKAPGTVANFLSYVDAGFYNGTVFHRVIDNFMIQGGAFTSRMDAKTPNGPIKNEADNLLANLRGTIAMARTADPDSATCQFFINLVDNASLNHKSKTPKGWGYTVFGKVIEGMDVVDAIGKVKTTTKNGAADNPVEPVIIQKASRVR